MEVLEFIYNNEPVNFQPTGNENLMVNATQMAKIFGKYTKDFLILDSTKNFIIECLKKENSPFINIKNEEELVTSKQKSGTWMHRILALKFAAWLDPKFELWVYSTIDKILLGHYREQKEATIEKLKAEQDLAKKKQELIEKNPDFLDFLAIEGRISAAEKKRLKAIKQSISQLRFDLFAVS